MRRIALGVAIALVLTGCTSDKSTAPTTTSPGTTPAVSSTTVATTAVPTTASTTSPTTTSNSSTTSTVAPTIAATPSTEPATSTTDSSGGPRVTLDPSTSALADAVSTFYEGYIPCVQAPASCDPTTFISPKGALLDSMRSSLAGKVQRGEFTSSDTRGTRWVVQLAQFVDENQGSAITCVYDALIVLGPPDATGTPTVVNDSTGSYTYVFTIYRQDGQWLVGDTAGGGTSSEATDRCGDS